MTFRYFNKNKYFKDIIDNYFKNNSIKHDNINESNLNYIDIDHTLKKCNNCAMINQFKDVNILGNKIDQYNNIIEYKKGHKPMYIPFTLSFTQDTVNSIEYLFVNNKKWIIKPENVWARKGIKVLNSFDNCIEWIKKFDYSNWIIQDYIDNPLLIDNKKFHFRIYVLAIKDNNGVNCFLYDEGFMYFSKLEYNNNNLDNDIHLSGENNKESVKVFPEYFINKSNKYIYYNKILPQFKKITRDTIMSVYNKIECPDGMTDKYRCFKLLGYDLLIDSSYNLYLAEINARLISLKYPPNGFKKQLYTNILNIVNSLEAHCDSDNSMSNSKFIYINNNDSYKDSIIQKPKYIIKRSKRKSSFKKSKKCKKCKICKIKPYVWVIILLLIIFRITYTKRS